ncbi:hypothetical protein P3342_004605 [Pyrenophora teres f. teres]|nr:hypothetical protein P3342_004605 [Pyrenophora teres f. teres]
MPPKKRVSDSAPSPRKRARGTASQPVAIDSQSYQSQPSALSPPPPYTHTFESRLRESQPEDAIVAPAEGSEQATLAPSSEAADDAKPGHRLVAPGKTPVASVYNALTTARVPISQAVANQINGFSKQRFRFAAVDWLVANNHPISEFETPAFRRLIAIANPLAEAALWKNHKSVSQYVIRLFDWLRPALSTSCHNRLARSICFDGWTTKGGKRGFLGIVAHYVNSDGKLRDLPIALPQLTGAHSGDRLAEVVSSILEQFSISERTLGYFVLDNASNNDTAVAAIAHELNFNPIHRRLRCGPHTINLIGQRLLWGRDADSYNNEGVDELADEAAFIKEWRKHGPLGVLLDIVNYIHTPQQYNLFEKAQRTAYRELPHDADDKLTILQPIKPVVTRWNSYFDCFERAIKLAPAINAYANTHIQNTAKEDIYADSQGKNRPAAPQWMRSDGLTAADWAVVTDYIEVLRPLKECTKRFEGRGEYSFGAIAEVIPTFEFLLTQLEARLLYYDCVVHDAHDEAPEDHLPINLRAALLKANEYYAKLDDSPAYYAATILHPRYKHYCDQAWAEKPDWLALNNLNFQALWADYKSLPLPRPCYTRAPKKPSNIDDAIDGIIDPTRGNTEEDEYEQWKREPIVGKGTDPIQYWFGLRDQYPNLSKMALTILSIPASSCECERVFSELGDLLEPRRRCISPELLAALHSVRRWRRAGFGGGDNDDMGQSKLTDEQMDVLYELSKWVGEDDDLDTWDDG